jgi:hypothetical protein
MRGVPIDFGVLASRNSTIKALGNANMNAKGDRLGPGGVIVKTQEQVDAEFAAARIREQQQLVDIKSPTLLPDEQPSVQPSSVKSDTAFPSIEDLIRDGVMPTGKKAKNNL